MKTKENVYRQYNTGDNIIHLLRLLGSLRVRCGCGTQLQKSVRKFGILLRHCHNITTLTLNNNNKTPKSCTVPIAGPCPSSVVLRFPSNTDRHPASTQSTKKTTQTKTPCRCVVSLVQRPNLVLSVAHWGT